MSHSPLSIALIVAGLLCGCGDGESSTDLSSPRATFRTLRSAIADRNVATLKSCFAPQADQSYVNGLAAVAEASTRLREATINRFDKEASKLVEGGALESTSEAPAVGEKTDNDTAVLTLTDGQVINLVRVGGSWKIASQGRPGSEPADMAAAGQVLSSLAASLSQIAADVAAGKYAEKTTDQSVQKIRDNIVAARNKALTL